MTAGLEREARYARHLPVPVASAVTLTLAEPLTAAALGVLLLGERMAPAGYGGVACLVLGIALLAVPKAGIMRRWTTSSSPRP